MVKLTKKVEYGLIALLHMDSVRHRGLVTAKEIAETYNIPGELLGKVLQSLTKAGLADSVQGSKGGYRLNRPIQELSLGEVVEKLDVPILIASCCDGSTNCQQHAACNIRTPIQIIQEEVLSYVHSLPLAKFRVVRPIPNLTLSFTDAGRPAQ